MDAKERELAQAAASLTVEDFRWLKEHGMVQERSPSSEETRPSHAERAEDSSQEGREGEKDQKRRRVRHQWPEVGTVLEADYYGVQYEAEVIAALSFGAGKAVKILIGPAAGLICRSLSGAMLKATEEQRRKQNLGKKGVANGWNFWKVRDGG